MSLLSGADFLSGFDPDQLNSLVMFFLQLYEQGIIVVETFWGLWLLPFGLIVYHSGFIPRIFGILLVIACFGYLAGTFTSLLIPEYTYIVSPFTMVSGTVGEFAIMLWLLIKGVREVKD